ncbi:MAG: hypothetical protein AVDCRST_MAG67-1990 [uncultured Solirubrobacteraceae bacterium]|uniref:Uncharacterized protein n=1 Tax=uncultured Solirubrobacteraceae bacterium TaxID=1162706 RepID=A0A6J4SQA8_9ACTN|nr:MAG: hypothetical protein AVDCRST_MAG67-1990 [uncultured Solirubrobacteraceae bacterium]
MPRRSILALVTCAVTVAGASGADAATLQTDTRCYQERQEVVVRGAGFAPLATINVARNGRVFASALADANGAFIGKFVTPVMPDEVRERLYDLSASDTINTAATRYRATKIFANFKPGSGDPETLRVRFTVNGFGLVKTGVPVYVHYVSPKGSERRTVRLGTTTGVCGRIVRTRKRRLFPFEAERGRWILQFDTRKKYERATSRRRTPWVRKPVEIS